MKHKLLLSYIIAVVLSIIIGIYSWILAVIFVLLAILTCLAVISFYLCNKVILKSNWFSNNYIFTNSNQFISNSGYRSNLKRNYSIANIGSNPALFSFDYPEGIGLNWSTGFHLYEMDFEIIKYYHSYVKSGGYIVIPIMPFTPVSQYLKSNKQCCGPLYYSKFENILDWSQVPDLPMPKERAILRKFPLSLYPNSLKYAIHDVSIDTRLEIDSMNMDEYELEMDSKKWMKIWYDEFNIQSLADFMDEKWIPYFDEVRAILREMIDFCTERNLRPVIMSMPMTSNLRSKFSQDDWSFLVTDFVKSIDRNVEFLDYSDNEELSDSKLYFNALFLNKKGRGVFTRKVLSDLSIYV